MIRFFRRIRQELLTDNKFSKYLIYGIGEIVLVVIGILIALEVNNRNEDRYKRAEMSNIYISIIDELENDSRILDDILPDFRWKISTLQRIIIEDLSLNEWTNNDSLFNSFYSFEDFSISQERFQLLKSKVAFDDETRVMNNQIADFYKKHMVDIEVRTHEANMSYHRNVAYWEENDAWFSAVIVDKEYVKLGRYAIGNPIFRNKMTWYLIMLSRLEFSLSRYQSESKILVQHIRSQLKKE